MDKIIYRCTSEVRINRNMKDLVWYISEEEFKNNKKVADFNPWNKDEAITIAKNYLMDDCVVIFRPARMEDRISRSRDAPVMFYFIEIMNQDESIKFASRRIYPWEKVIEFASWFKGLSFVAATRVWKVKKL